jgi:16S rRNA (guanine527-N7)-methyltransferase
MSEHASACSAALDILRSGARELGLNLDAEAQRQFEMYSVLLQDASRSVNLTAVRDTEGIMRTLFLDSLTLLQPLQAYISPRGQMLVVDVGSGAGIPGLPLKIVRPEWQLVLIESVGKKARFLSSVVEALDLARVTVLNERAEAAGWRKELRDTADACLARAVAPLSVLLELCTPFVRSGGVLLFPKSGDVTAEIDAARVAAHTMRAELLERWTVPEALGLGSNRFVLVYRKVGPTPPGYPRRIGLARSRPLGTGRQGVS